MQRASKTLRAHDDFAAMVFTQLTYRESLQGIEACLNARPALAYHMGIHGRVTRTNLVYANEHRDWRVFAEAAGVLMRRTQELYTTTPPELGLEANLFALDATVIELSVALFPWARWKRTLVSVKLSVLLDLRGEIPVFAFLHDGNIHEVASLDELPVKSGSYYVMGRGYLDFSRLHRLHQDGVFFLTRLKSNTRFYVTESPFVDRSAGLRCDQTIKLNSPTGRASYPDVLRRISYIDQESGNALIFLTN